MKRFCSLCLVVVMGLAHGAAAQPAATEPATAPFLEKRVPEELATEGIVLSRNNLGLKLEQIGDKWLVSLIDLGTDRVAASTKVDVLPPDREAAVAAMTHVVAELSAQILGHVERPAPPVAPPPATEGRGAHELAEQKFNRQSIRFGTTFLVGGGTIQPMRSGRGWHAYQGELDHELSAAQFYTAMGRTDLISGYNSRRQWMFGGYVVAGVGMVTFAAALLGGGDVDNPNRSTYLGISTVGILVACAGIWVGVHYQLQPHPIDIEDAKTLADAYNLGLRRQLGLPVAARRPLLRDVKLAPYLAPEQGGLALAGRF